MRLRLYLSEVYDAIAAYAQSRGYSGRQITHAVIKFMPEKNSGMTCVEIDVDRHPAATETKAPGDTGRLRDDQLLQRLRLGSSCGSPAEVRQHLGGLQRSDPRSMRATKVRNHQGRAGHTTRRAAFAWRSGPAIPQANSLPAVLQVEWIDQRLPNKSAV